MNPTSQSAVSPRVDTLRNRPSGKPRGPTFRTPHRTTAVPLEPHGDRRGAQSWIAIQRAACDPCARARHGVRGSQVRWTGQSREQALNSVSWTYVSQPCSRLPSARSESSSRICRTTRRYSVQAPTTRITNAQHGTEPLAMPTARTANGGVSKTIPTRSSVRALSTPAEIGAQIRELLLTLHADRGGYDTAEQRRDALDHAGFCWCAPGEMAPGCGCAWSPKNAGEPRRN